MQKHLFTILFFCALAGASALAGCKKETTLTTEQRIVGKWTMDNAIGEYVIMDETYSDTTQFTGTDHFQFNANGSLSILEGQTDATGKWHVESNKVLITETGYIDYPGGFVIKKLTSSELQLYYEQTTDVGSIKQTLNLKK